MFDYKIFTIIFILFIIFICIQLYYYTHVYYKNQNKLNKIENYENELKYIDRLSTKKDYVLDEKTLDNLLKDYNNL